MKLICIKCPRGCEITVEKDKITGNGCTRGLEYAKEELSCPMRTVTYLLKSGDGVVPVKTDKDVPKDRINDVINEISKLNILNTHIGQIIIKNVLGLNSNIIVTGNKYSE